MSQPPTTDGPTPVDIQAYQAARERAYRLVGQAIAVIGDVEMLMERLLLAVFPEELGLFKALPKLDFRSKIDLLEGWIEIVEPAAGATKTRSRLQGLYTRRNTLAHGHLRWINGEIVIENPRSGAFTPLSDVEADIGRLEELWRDLHAALGHTKVMASRRAAALREAQEQLASAVLVRE